LTDNESIEKITSQIIHDGEKEIESIRLKAEETAAGIIARAEAEAARIAEKLLKEAKEKGDLEQRRLLSSVNLEVRRAKLRTREEVVTVVRERAADILRGQREGGDYGDILAGLITEAISALDGEHFIVSVDRRDLAILESDVFAAVRDAAAGMGQRVERLEARALEQPALGGARVGVPGGNVVFDNTFEARIYRLRDDVRNIIFEEVFSSPGNEDESSA
jgi:vacuolar-type H+-ATPase subunit E/Vma4